MADVAGPRRCLGVTVTPELAEAIRNFGRASANYGVALERMDLDLIVGRSRLLKQAAAYLEAVLSSS